MKVAFIYCGAKLLKQCKDIPGSDIYVSSNILQRCTLSGFGGSLSPIEVLQSLKDHLDQDDSESCFAEDIGNIATALNWSRGSPFMK